LGEEQYAREILHHDKRGGIKPKKALTPARTGL
jgi:hypothetical protein